MSTKNCRTWNNAVQVANCRSLTVKLTQDWSISWMAMCMPYSNCSFARVSESPSEGRNYASELFTPWEGFTKKKKHHQLATHWEELCSLIICNSIFMGGFMQKLKRVYT